MDYALMGGRPNVKVSFNLLCLCYNSTSGTWNSSDLLEGREGSQQPQSIIRELDHVSDRSISARNDFPIRASDWSTEGPSWIHIKPIFFFLLGFGSSCLFFFASVVALVF